MTNAYYPSSIFPIQYTNPDNGELASGFTIEAYVAGLSTPATMYSDKNGTVLGTSVTLNSGGYPINGSNTPVQIWLQTGREYDFVLKDDASNTEWTLDDLALNLNVSLYATDYSSLITLFTDADLSNGTEVTLTDAGISGTGFVRNSASHGFTATKGVIVRLDDDWYWQRSYKGGIDVRWFGVDGTADAADFDLATAAASAQANGGEIVIDNIDVDIQTNTTIPSDVDLKVINGGRLSIAIGAVLTINGGLIAERSQIFEGLGTVTFAETGKIDKVYPEWWGAVADHRALGDALSTESGAAIQLCVTAAQNGHKKIKLSNGGYKNDATNIVVGDRITIKGDNREDAYIITTSLSSLTGTAMLFDDVVSGDVDSEEWLVQNWMYRVECSTLDYGVRFDPSYGQAVNWAAKTTSTQAQALVSTNPTVNTNQVHFVDCEIRSQSNPGGNVGLWFQRGANASFRGGYAGNFDSPIKVGNEDEFYGNLSIGNGALVEVFDTLNDDNAQCIEVVNTYNLDVTCRLQFVNALQRGIRVTGSVGATATGGFRGGLITNISVDNTSAAEAFISFDGVNSEQPKGLVVGANDLRVGGSNINAIELINKVNALTITGITQASPAVVTTSGNFTTYGISSGDYVYLYDVVGMTEVNHQRYLAANVTATTLELQNENSTGFTAYISGGSIAKMADPDFVDLGNSFSATSNRGLINNVMADGDTTPSVGYGNYFITNNSSATSITDFDGIRREQSKTITIIVNDANTTFDFTGSSLRGNGGVDLAAAQNSAYTFVSNDTLWHLVSS